MKTFFYIKNDQTYKYLNKKGGWNKSIKTYNLLSFESKSEAQAAVPNGVPCIIESHTKKEKEIPKDAKYALFFKGKVYNKNNQFDFLSKQANNALAFNSLEEAVSKADSLDLNMDFVDIEMI